MRLSTKTEYGIKLLLDIAYNNGENEYVSIKKIADTNDFSENYLEKTIRLLKRAKLVESNRGASGGYKLTKPICILSLYDIFLALDEDLVKTRCFAKGDKSNCDLKTCGIYKAFKIVDDSLEDILKKITLRDIIKLQ